MKNKLLLIVGGGNYNNLFKVSLGKQDSSFLIID